MSSQEISFSGDALEFEDLVRDEFIALLEQFAIKNAAINGRNLVVEDDYCMAIIPACKEIQNRNTFRQQ